VEGHATIDGAEISRVAVPADDTTQAFVIHHLVPASELLAVVTGTNRGRQPIRITSPQPMKLPTGGQVVLSNSYHRPPFNVKEAQFKLSEPPDGISVQGASVTAEGLAITFQADPAKVKPGLRGNLFVEAFTPAAKDGKIPPKNHWSAGFMPAIPFKVTAPVAAPTPISELALPCTPFPPHHL